MPGKNKSANNKQQPIHTVRCGDIIATAYRKQTNCGLSYVHYLLTRRWVGVTSGKEAQAAAFFPTNEQDMKQAIEEMSKFLRENEGKVLSSQADQSDATVIANDKQHGTK